MTRIRYMTIRCTMFAVDSAGVRVHLYRGTSLIKNYLLPGPFSRPMPRALRWS